MNGIKNGEIQGEKKKSIEIAKKLLKMGMNVEQIKEVTDLTNEELEQIKES